VLLPRLEGELPVQVVYRPRDDRLLLGGDFSDCQRLPDRETAFIIGDVPDTARGRPHRHAVGAYEDPPGPPIVRSAMESSSW
jgi:hypothetical protein